MKLKEIEISELKEQYEKDNVVYIKIEKYPLQNARIDDKITVRALLRSKFYIEEPEEE